MNSDKYIKLAKVTELRNYRDPLRRLNEREMRLLHGAMGLATEAGEFLSPIKAHIYYGRELDETNLREELGDIMWYMAVICDCLGVDFEEIWERNIKKLQARYGDKYSDFYANNRNLAKEYRVLKDKKK